MTARISPYIVLAPPQGLLPHPPLPPRTARRAARSLPPCGAPYCCAARSRRARTVTVRPPMPMTPIYASRVRCPGSWTERLPATYVCDSASALRAPPLSSRPPLARLLLILILLHTSPCLMRRCRRGVLRRRRRGYGVLLLLFFHVVLSRVSPCVFCCRTHAYLDRLQCQSSIEHMLLRCCGCGKFSANRLARLG